VVFGELVMETVGVFNPDYYCGICHSDVDSKSNSKEEKLFLVLNGYAPFPSSVIRFHVCVDRF